MDLLKQVVQISLAVLVVVFVIFIAVAILSGILNLVWELMKFAVLVLAIVGAYHIYVRYIKQ